MTRDVLQLPGYLEKPGHDAVYEAHYYGQIAWKERFNTRFRRDESGAPLYRYFLPEDEALNLHADYRDAMMKHVNRPGKDEKIKLHEGFGNVMSSQAFAMNLAGPFLKAPHKLLPSLQALAGDSLEAEIHEVKTVDIEVVGRTNYFNEPGSRGDRRSSPDIGVWWSTGKEKRLLLIEVKYTEPDFGTCSSGRGGDPTCDKTGSELFSGESENCPKNQEGRPYWELIKEHNLFDESVIGQSPCCPFRFEAYQLMRYQLLAAVIEADPEAPEKRVDLVTLCHPDNQLLRKLTLPIAGTDEVFDLWPKALRRPNRFHAWSARDWVFQAGKAPDLANWAMWMTTRYFS